MRIKDPVFRIAFVVGFLLMFYSPASAASRSAAIPLSDAQLDGVSAGVIAAADGTAKATGDRSSTDISVASMAEMDGFNNYGTAFGQVTASASANAGSGATASSVLSLSVNLR